MYIYINNILIFVALTKSMYPIGYTCLYILGLINVSITVIRKNKTIF